MSNICWMCDGGDVRAYYVCESCTNKDNAEKATTVAKMEADSAYCRTFGLPTGGHEVSTSYLAPVLRQLAARIEAAESKLDDSTITKEPAMNKDGQPISKDQSDPIAMYIVARESLNMSAGKIAAQVGHAVESLIRCTNFDRLSNENFNLYDKYRTEFGSRKIVLRANEKEWEKTKELIWHKSIVIDAGLTEIPSGSETVIALWPMHKSMAHGTILKRLQTLK